MVKKQKSCISVNEPQNEKIKVLYFLQLLKFDKTKCLHFFISSSNSRDMAIFLFSAKQGLKNHWKKTKCPYLGYNGLKWKNKGTLFSPTFKVEGNKVPIFFILGLNSWDMAAFSFFRFSRKNEKNLKNDGEEVIRDLSLKWSLEAPICSHQTKS